jgi:hypothetical protein
LGLWLDDLSLILGSNLLLLALCKLAEDLSSILVVFDVFNLCFIPIPEVDVVALTLVSTVEEVRWVDLVDDCRWLGRSRSLFLHLSCNKKTWSFLFLYIKNDPEVKYQLTYLPLD